MPLRPFFLTLFCLGCAVSPASPDVADVGAGADATVSEDRTVVDADLSDRVSPLDAIPDAVQDANPDLTRPTDSLSGDASDSQPADATDGGRTDVINCAVTEGVDARWVYPSGRMGAICAPLAGMHLGYQTENCRPRFVSGAAAITQPSYFVFEARGSFFERTGPAAGGFVMTEVGSDCAMPDTKAMTCRYRRLDLNCAMEVTRAGRVGDVVEAVLTAPCQLLHDFGGAVTSVTLTSARIRGRLLYGGDSVVPTDTDAGADCGLMP